MFLMVLVHPCGGRVPDEMGALLSGQLTILEIKCTEFARPVQGTSEALYMFCNGDNWWCANEDG
jgi:hypothetical protein